MYYRIFDQESETYVTAAYNGESKSALKREVSDMLSSELSDEDLKDLESLPWDKYTAKLKMHGLVIEEGITPFNIEESGSGNVFPDNDLDDWDDLDDDDDYTY